MIGVAEFISDENLLGRFFPGRYQPHAARGRSTAGAPGASC